MFFPINVHGFVVMFVVLISMLFCGQALAVDDFLIKNEEAFFEQEQIILQPELSLQEGEKKYLDVVTNQGSMPRQSLFWYTSDPQVAVVEGNGLVTGVKEGTAVIMVETEDGNAIATSNITVSAGQDVASENYYTAFSEGRSVSGKIMLPAGEVAPAGGLSFSLSAQPITGGSSSSSSVTIPEGKTEIVYTINIPMDQTDKGFRLSYWLSTSGTDYAQSGYYSISGTISSSTAAHQLDLSQGNLSNIDMTVLTTRLIQGSIQLPPGEVAPEDGISFSMSAQSLEGGGWFSENALILEGKGKTDYAIRVPLDQAEAGFHIRYWRTGTAYYREGYFNSDGTVSVSSLAEVVDVSQGDVAGINLTVLRANTIEGSIHLPAGETAPQGGLSFTVLGSVAINNRTHLFSSSAMTMSEGENEINYSLHIPVDQTNLTLRYRLNTTGTNFAREGFFNTTGTVSVSAEAELLEVTDAVFTDIDLTVLKARKIQGTIRLPQGDKAPANGFNLFFSAQPVSGGQSFSSSVTMPEGENELEYTINIPLDKSDLCYRIQYTLHTMGTEYVRSGYYGSDGIVYDRLAAHSISISGADVAGIDIEIIKGRKIQGMIRLPEGETAPALGTSINLIAWIQGQISFASWITIPSGEDNASFTIIAPPNEPCSGYWLSYYRSSTGTETVQRGYYNETATTTSSWKATPVDVSEQDLFGLEMEMIPGNRISGSLSLPHGAVAPAGHYGGLRAYVQSITENGENVQVTVDIAEGDDVAHYSMIVPRESGYRVSYRLDTHHPYGYSGEEYVRQGYYGTTGMTTSYGGAMVLDLSSNDATGIDLEIMEGNAIKGTISIPTVATDDIRVFLYASGVAGEYVSSDAFIIPAGDTSVPYSLTVEKANDYWLRYSLSGDITEYVRLGYYNESETTTNIDNVTHLDLRNNHQENVNFTILSGSVVTGHVSRPDGAATDELLRVFVRARAASGEYASSQQVTLNQCSMSAPYTLTAPPVDDYVVEYYIHIYTGEILTDTYARTGYYGGMDTVTTVESAEKVNLSAGDISNINLVLLPAEPQQITAAIAEIIGVESIEVKLGTTEAEVLASLAKTTTIIDTNDDVHTVTLNWILIDYDGDMQGKYLATGTFHLPAGIGQSDPPTGLQITSTVTVKEADECFIATAAYGSKLAPGVTILRQFRDTQLLNNLPGQAFVSFYYQVSPPFAEYIAGNEALKIIVRTLLLPVVAIAYLVMQPWLLLLAALLVMLYYRRRIAYWQRRIMAVLVNMS